MVDFKHRYLNHITYQSINNIHAQTKVGLMYGLRHGVNGVVNSSIEGKPKQLGFLVINVWLDVRDFISLGANYIRVRRK